MKRTIAFIIPLMLLAASCTDLEPKIYSDITIDRLMEDAESSTGYIVSPVYGTMRWFNEDRNVWDLYEVGTDEWIVPVNSDGGWNDNGIWQRMNRHNWYTTDPHMEQVWQYVWYGISSCCNRVLYQLESAGVELDRQTVAEIKVARAFYYYQLLTFFGNVPIETSFNVPEGYLPQTRSRKEVYDFVVSEIRDNMDYLSESRNYGRFNKWAAKHMLARVYLNAESWLGPEYASKRDSTVILCDEIINSQKYSLDSSYPHIFSLDNQSSPEVIFAIPYDESTKTPVLHCIYGKTMHYKGAPVYAASSAGYNGLRANPRFVSENFDAEEDPATRNYIEDSGYDKRYGWTYLMGQQYDYTTGDSLFFDAARKKPYNHTNFITNPLSADEFDGYRFGKYEIKIGQKWDTDQDWVVYRYGETLMMKAECLLRDGEESLAAQIVNHVRARSFDSDAPQSVRELTPQQLSATVEIYGVEVKYGEFLRELGREFAGEAMRREQLIRFDNLYTRGEWFSGNGWGEYSINHEPHTVLFPIPDKERISNNKLLQNEGYAK